MKFRTGPGAQILSRWFVVGIVLGLCSCGGTRSHGTHGNVRWARYERHEIPARGYDVEHYRIELTLHPKLRAIDARCVLRMVATETLSRVVLDLEGLSVDKVLDSDGKSLAFEQRDGRLSIELAGSAGQGEALALDVRYHGRPVTGLWFSGRSWEDGSPTQCFTQGQAENNRGWFPCFDHPSDRATSEIVVSMPEHWIGVAPGECIDVTHGNGTRREHWRMMDPHPSYLVSLVAGDLVRTEGSFRGLPLSYYAEDKYLDWIEEGFAETGAILGFFEEYTGVPYPYVKYSQAVVANFPGGGMENISATTMTPLVFGDELSRRDHSSVTLIAHEAAHQWFGDLVTCKDWTHLWLNEGFATYMALLYYEATRGTDEFRCRLRDSTLRYLKEDRDGARRPAVHSFWKDPEDVFDTRTYEGAAARLHLLRSILGETEFREGVRAYVASRAGTNVITSDLQEALEKTSGVDLEVFFREWIHGPGFPELAFEWHWDEERGAVRGTVRQTQDFSGGTARVFHVPMQIQVGQSLHRIELMERTQEFTLTAEARPEYVLFDPQGWIPKTVNWPSRSNEEWIAIARQQGSVDARRNAALALGPNTARIPRTNPERAELTAELVRLVEEDGNAWVRKDAAISLAWLLEGNVWEALVNVASEDPEAMVRTAALRSLAYCGPHEGLADFGRRKFDEGYSWETMGAAAVLVCAADPVGAPRWLLQNLELDSPHDHLAGLLLACLARFPGRAIEEELAIWACNTTLSPTARAVAVRGLTLEPENRASVREVLTGLLEEEDFRLRQAVIESLGVMDDVATRRVLSQYYPRARNPKERRAIEASTQTVP